MIFYKVIQYLYPRSKAFRSVANNYFRRFIKALGYVPEDFSSFVESVYGDLWPETTRELEKWEQQFGIVFAPQYDVEIRRKLLQSYWNINSGGQGKDYLEKILQLINSDIHVVENLPVRNPCDSNVVYQSVNNNRRMVNGNKYAICGYKTGETDFTPTVLKNDAESFYSLPSYPSYWSNCFFVCKDVVRNKYGGIVYVNKLQVEKKWRTFMEYIILKIKPVHTTAVMFVEYI